MSEIDVSKCKYYNPNEEGYDIDTGEFKKGACEIKVAIGDYGEFSHYGLCTDSCDCYYKQLQQLKAENEELHRRQNVFNILKKIDKYKQCLDEVEEYCKGKNLKNDSKYFVATGYILKLIKEAKEGEE